MSTAQLVIVCLSSLIAVAIVAAAAAVIADLKVERAEQRAEPGPSMAGKSLVVHTRKPDDQSIRGVVDAHYADRIVLRDAAYLHASGAQPAGGVVDVLLINVSSWQELQAPRDPTLVSH